nr:hypothetical protein [Rhodococcus sp. HNM0569]
MKLLDPEVIWVRRTAHGSKVVIGPNEVLAAVQRGDVARVEARRVSVDGEPGILAWGPTGRPIALMSCTVADGKIVAVESLVDPGRLARMDLPGRRG